MFKSLKAKILALVLFILALVCGASLFFSWQGVRSAMLRSELRAAENVLRLVEVNVAGRYKSLLKRKISTINNYRDQLGQFETVARSGLDRFAELGRRANLSRRAIRDQSLEWLKSLDLGVMGFLFIYTPELELVAARDNAARLDDLTSYRDVKGRVVAEAMREETAKYGHSSAVFYWPSNDPDKDREKRLGYFFRYPSLNWIVCASVSVEAIEEEVDQALAEAVDILRDNVPRIRIAGEGFVFLFNGREDILVPPRGLEQTETLYNAITGNELLDDLMAAARDSGSDAVANGPMEFSLVGEDGGRRYLSFVSYFKSLDWYMVTAAPLAGIQAPARKLVLTMSLVILGALLVSLVAALLITSRIARPLARLTHYAKSLSEKDFTDVRREESEIADLPARYHDEVGRLADTFLFMEETLRRNIQELVTSTASRERIQSELNVAHDIQMGLLPKTFPPFPERGEFDLFAVLEPAKEVGGDLYDFFLLDENKLCFTVGDVSDKGVPAALFMAITRTLIKGLAERGQDPATMLTNVNNDLSRDNPNSMFVTLVIAVLDVRTGVIQYANGGHNPPMKLGAAGAEFLPGVSGPLVGGFEGVDFAPLELKLEPGETFLLYTDGVTEAMNHGKELFSEERLHEAVLELVDRPARDVVLGVMDAVRRHVAGVEQSDDITVLAVRYTPFGSIRETRSGG